MKISEKVKPFLAAYSIGICFGAIFAVLRMFGRVKIRGRLPVFEDNLILTYNHPSFLETVMVPLLYSPWVFLNPFRFAPLGIPNKAEYFDKKWFLPLRWVCIPVDGKRRMNKESFSLMINALREKRRIAYPPEGGRTGKGAEFVHSPKGKKIRNLEAGAGLLALKSGAKVLPVWVEISDDELESRDLSFSEIVRLLWQLSFKSKMVFKIGLPRKIKARTRQAATQEITENLLKLADEEE